MKKVESNAHKEELLILLRLFRRDMILNFSYEEKDSGWILFIHLSNGVIQINGNKEHLLGDTVYFSPIIDVIL